MIKVEMVPQFLNGWLFVDPGLFLEWNKAASAAVSEGRLFYWKNSRHPSIVS